MSREEKKIYQVEANLWSYLKTETKAAVKMFL